MDQFVLDSLKHTPFYHTPLIRITKNVFSHKTPSSYDLPHLEFPEAVLIFTGLELRRLENRYVRRNHRNTYVSGARYVDGEYVYGSSSQVSVSSGSSGKAKGMAPVGGMDRGKRWARFRW